MKGVTIMTVRNLGKGNMGKVMREIHEMTIEMYQDITSAILHDESPVTIATDITDIWEVVAQTLYNNTELSHKQFLRAMVKINDLVELCYKSLGVEPICY